VPLREGDHGVPIVSQGLLEDLLPGDTPLGIYCVQLCFDPFWKASAETSRISCITLDLK